MKKAKANRYLPIDTLRGIAIIGVVLHHAAFIQSENEVHQIIRSLGRYGVQLFFIISGIMVSYAWSKNNNLKNYIFNRVYRVLPLFIVSGFIYNFNNLNSKTYKLMLIVTSHFITPGNNNIDTAAPGGWSIVLELFFYALFPIIMLTKSKKNMYYFYFLQSTIFLIYNFYLQNKISQYMKSMDLPQQDLYIENYLFFNFINQAPLFFLGVGLYYCLYQNESIIKFYSLQILLVMVSILLKFLIENFSYNTNLLESAKNLQINFLIFYISLGLVIVIFMKLNINIKFLNFIGFYSYGIYIFHYLGIDLVNNLIDLSISDSYIIFFLKFLLMFIFTIFLAKVSEDFLFKNKINIRKFIGI